MIEPIEQASQQEPQTCAPCQQGQRRALGRRAPAGILHPRVGAALDELGIDHQDGLTDAELDGISELDADAAQALASTLSQTYDPLDVMLYLRFMGAELSGFEV